MFDLFAEILRVNTFTTCVVLALTGWGALLINIATASAILSLSFVPAMGFGALAVIYGLSQAGVTFTAYADANVIISATLGMVFGFLMMIVMIRLFAWATDIRKPVVKGPGAAPA